MTLRVRGIDFTSAPRRAKPITLAECALAGGELLLTGLRALPDLEAFEAGLREPGPWLAAMDFPFGLPRAFLEAQGLATSWSAYVTWVAGLSRRDFERVLLEYKACRPGGSKEPARATDRLCRAQSPLKLFRVPVAKMFYEGAPRLLRAGVTVLPLAQGDPRRIVAEGYPALLARRLVPGRPYKSDTRTADPAPMRGTRRAMIAALSAGTAGPCGVRLVMSPRQRRTLLEDAAGDYLDAVLCAVQAALAYRTHGERLGVPLQADPLEGWILGCDAGPAAP